MDLKSWTQSRISALYEAEDPAAEFDATFSPDAKVVVDGEAVETSKHKENIVNIHGSGLTKGAKVEWGDCTSSDDQVQGSFTLTRSMKFRVRAAPAQNITAVSFSASVHGNDGDRRITQYEDSRKHIPQKINLPHMRHDNEE